jgi:single-stranded-DNA-specific exonuclease
MEIKNLKKAAQRILKAVKNKENIILYGDSDLDGAASVIILKESIQTLGKEINTVYFPNIEIEGHGISEIGLNYLKAKLLLKARRKKKTKFSSPKFTPALFVVMDCGMQNFKEIDLANKLGFEIIIIDHHQILGKLPNASIIVNPKQENDKYPFKELAATGLVFKLSELLLKNKMTLILRENFLELTALATIADMMPKEGDNKIFIEQGLATIENSWRPGLKTFFEMELFNDIIDLHQKISRLISILNVRDLEDGMPVSFSLLSSSSKQKSEEMIKKLFKKNQEKKEKIDEIIKEIEWQISNKEEPLIFMGSDKWGNGFNGLIASILSNKYKKPTFIFKKEKKESQGAVRIQSDINSVFLMEKCSEYLLTFGGHPKASGFKIKNENLEKFKNCLIKNLKK